MNNDTNKAQYVYCILCRQWKLSEISDRIVEGFDYIYCDACISDRTTLYRKFLEASDRDRVKELNQLPYRKNKAKERNIQWKRENAKRVRHHNKMRINRRRSRIGNAINDFSVEEWERCLEYWGHKCAVCGRPAGLWHTIASDHWIPVASLNYPGTTATNIIPLCHGLDGCNNKKGRKSGRSFLIGMMGETKAKKKLVEIERYFEWVRRSTTNNDETEAG